MSSKPNINMENFEVFLMDYFDGTLSPEMTDQLMAFLDSNPDLKAELEDFNNYNLNPIEEFSENNTLKSSLKREESEQPKNFINHENLDDYLIHGLENNLNPSESEALRTFLILNPEAQKSANLVEKLKLTPDKKLRFDDKNLLYKTSNLSNLTLSEDTAEEFIIAFCEGDLTINEAENLKKWIAANPKWQSVLAAYQNLKLTPDKKLRFENKNLLYKTSNLSNLTLSEDNAEEFIIAFCEGDLTNNEAENLKKWIAANPKWQSVLAVYQNLKLSPDYSIQFPNKDSLRIRTHIS